jgi:glycosyltransferase involved in cell wall biosynthesis
MIRALKNWGCDVYVQPTWVDAPIPKDVLPLFGKPLTPPFDLTINHWDPGNLDLGMAPRKATRLAVAWTMWEFMAGPAGPTSALRSFGHSGTKTLRDRLQWYDLVLGYDPVSIQALAPYCPKSAGRGILQGGYESKDWPAVERDWFGEKFVFLMHGALNARKQPWLAIQAFNELKAEQPEFEPAVLAVHNTVGGIPQEIEKAIPGLRIYQDAFDNETLQRFYQAGHVLLSPSLGEGKNLPALEMLSTGGTVIATNVGGHTMWIRDDIAYALDYTLTPVFPDKPRGAQGAAVSVQDLKDAMWAAFSDRGAAKARGDLGAKLIPQMCDWSVVVEGLFRRCNDLVPHNGEMIYEMAQECHRAPDWRMPGR